MPRDPSTIRFRVENSPLTICDALTTRGWVQVETDGDDWDLLWCEVGHLKNTFKRLEGHQRVPHFRNHYELTRKNRLARNLYRLKQKLLREDKEREAELCECMPKTFELPADYCRFGEYYRWNPNLTWIVKPAGGSQGRGIFLIRRMRDLQYWMYTKDFDQSPPSVWSPIPVDRDETFPECWVIQRYISDPYLLAGRKFDLRIYVVVTSFLPLKVWVARDGFARVSGSKFDPTELQDNHIHLTNSSIQLDPELAAARQGYKWHMRRLKEFLVGRHGAIKIFNLFQSIAKIILTSLQSVQPIIMHSKQCFELYGYDILLDKYLTPWLLEVNASPSVTPTDENDYQLKFQLLTDVLNVLDMEGVLTGEEIRVGGLDLLWDDGPIYLPCPGATEIGPVITNPAERPLNICIGANNDREENLKQTKDWGSHATRMKFTNQL